LSQEIDLYENMEHSDLIASTKDRLVRQDVADHSDRCNGVLERDYCDARNTVQKWIENYEPCGVGTLQGLSRSCHW